MITYLDQLRGISPVKCPISYIAIHRQVITTLGRGMYKHKYDVKFNQKTPGSQHFSKIGHGVSDMMFSVVEWINKDAQSSKDLR